MNILMIVVVVVSGIVGWYLLFVLAAGLFHAYQTFPIVRLAVHIGAIGLVLMAIADQCQEIYVNARERRSHR